MTGRFDEVTAVERDAPGRYTAQVDPQWSIAGKPNGGYLMALCARAALEELSASGEHHPHPVAVSATYLSPTAFGPARIEVEELRRGRGTSVLRARLSDADGTPRVEAALTCGRLHGDSEPHHDGVRPPQLPPIEDCVRLPVEGPGFQVPLMGVVAEHLDPACLGWTQGTPSGAGELRGYLALADGREPDPLALLLAIDAFPPATFDLGLGGWVPTLQMSAWVRALPAPGPLVVRQRAGLVEGSTVDESCEVWDSRGRLVATSSQLAGVRVKRAH